MPIESLSDITKGGSSAFGGGSGAGFAVWTWSTALSGAPATGVIAADDTNPLTVTSIRVNIVSNEGMAFDASLTNLLQGDRIYIQEKDSATNGHTYDVTGVPVDNTTYWTIPVTYVTGVGALPVNDQHCVFRIGQTAGAGATGPQGPAGPTGPAGPQGPPGEGGSGSGGTPQQIWPGVDYGVSALALTSITTAAQDLSLGWMADSVVTPVSNGGLLIVLQTGTATYLAPDLSYTGCSAVATLWSGTVSGLSSMTILLVQRDAPSFATAPAVAISLLPQSKRAFVQFIPVDLNGLEQDAAGAFTYVVQAGAAVAGSTTSVPAAAVTWGPTVTRGFSTVFLTGSTTLANPTSVPNAPTDVTDDGGVLDQINSNLVNTNGSIYTFSSMTRLGTFAPSGNLELGGTGHGFLFPVTIAFKSADLPPNMVAPEGLNTRSPGHLLAWGDNGTVRDIGALNNGAFTAQGGEGDGFPITGYTGGLAYPVQLSSTAEAGPDDMAGFPQNRYWFNGADGISGSPVTTDTGVHLALVDTGKLLDDSITQTQIAYLSDGRTMERTYNPSISTYSPWRVRPRIHVGTVAPTSPIVGDMWLDTN